MVNDPIERLDRVEVRPSVTTITANLLFVRLAVSSIDLKTASYRLVRILGRKRRVTADISAASSVVKA
jgi:hypothetical protein